MALLMDHSCVMKQLYYSNMSAKQNLLIASRIAAIVRSKAEEYY